MFSHSSNFQFLRPRWIFSRLPSTVLQLGGKNAEKPRSNSSGEGGNFTILQKWQWSKNGQFKASFSFRPQGFSSALPPRLSYKSKERTLKRHRLEVRDHTRAKRVEILQYFKNDSGPKNEQYKESFRNNYSGNDPSEARIEMFLFRSRLIFYCFWTFFSLHFIASHTLITS